MPYRVKYREPGREWHKARGLKTLEYAEMLVECFRKEGYEAEIKEVAQPKNRYTPVQQKQKEDKQKIVDRIAAETLPGIKYPFTAVNFYHWNDHFRGLLHFEINDTPYRVSVDNGWKGDSYRFRYAIKGHSYSEYEVFFTIDELVAEINEFLTIVANVPKRDYLYLGSPRRKAS